MIITRRQTLQQAALACCTLALSNPFAMAAEDSAGIAGRNALRAHARRRGLLAGCAVGARELREDAAFRQVLAQQYDLVVAENAMKFGPLRPTPTTFNFTDADALVDFARQHDMQVRGHNFVWHQMLPAWFAGTVTKDNAQQILTHHILTVGGRYSGKMQSWDVVNEAINPTDGRPDGLRKSPWLELLGPGYLALAYRTARQADPHAKLAYNDYGIEYDDEAAEKKRAAVLALLRQLKSQNVPIDALGIQSHLGAGHKAVFGKALPQFIRDVQALGLEVYITELDVNDDAIATSDIAERDRIVAGIYRNYLDCVLASPSVKAVLTWGMTDAHTWLNSFNRGKKQHPDRPERPLPFDAELKPTPAYFALRDAIDHAPRRRLVPARPALPA